MTENEVQHYLDYYEGLFHIDFNGKVMSKKRSNDDLASIVVITYDTPSVYGDLTFECLYDEYKVTTRNNETAYVSELYGAKNRKVALMPLDELPVPNLMSVKEFNKALEDIINRFLTVCVRTDAETPSEEWWKEVT